MKRTPIILALSAAGIIAGGFGLYQFGMQQGMQMSSPQSDTVAATGAADMEDAAAEKKVLYWHDPMVPGPKFDKPGKSPFMDMQLVPVYAEDGVDEGTVSINPRVQQNLGIRTAAVTLGDLTAPTVVVGNVAYNERTLALVQARSNGYIERLHVRATLDPVRKGQPLAELYVPDWVAAQEEYLSVKRMQDQSMAAPGLADLLGAARQRMRLAGMSDAQISAVEHSGKVQARVTISAPVSGVVTELLAREGMTVMSGAPMFRINGLETIWVIADIPENSAARVRPGNAVEASSPSLPGVVFKGKVSALLPEVDTATRTLKARIELANPKQQLVPGMFANVSIASAVRRDVLLVPSEAVIKTGQRSVVMAALGDGKFMPVDIETGMEARGQTEVLKGLQAGQQVVVSGQFLIDSEASLKSTGVRMSEMPEAAPAAMNEKDTMGQPAVHRAEGKIEQIESESITISHGPVASLQWGPMTMGFNPPAGGMPKNVAVGDSVVFEFRTGKEGEFDIISIAPSAQAPAAKGAKR